MNTEEIRARVAAIMARAGITFDVTGGQRTKRKDWDCYAWRAAFGRGPLRELEAFDYYCGLAHVTKPKSQFIPPRPVPPSAADVLHSLVLESGAERESFKDWCDTCGYSADSIDAFETYRACCAIGERLRKVFTRAQIAELAEALQDY